MTSPSAKSPFLDQITAAFGDLLRHGALSLASSAYDAEAFGNAEVVLAGPTLDLRLVRDRGDVWADVRPSGLSEWRPLERVLRAIGVPGSPHDGLLSVEETASLVSRYLNELVSGFSPESRTETLQSLHRLDAEAAQQLQRRWQPKKKD